MSETELEEKLTHLTVQLKGIPIQQKKTSHILTVTDNTEEVFEINLLRVVGKLPWDINPVIGLNITDLANPGTCVIDYASGRVCMRIVLDESPRLAYHITLGDTTFSPKALNESAHYHMKFLTGIVRDCPLLVSSLIRHEPWTKGVTHDMITYQKVVPVPNTEEVYLFLLYHVLENYKPKT